MENTRILKDNPDAPSRHVRLVICGFLVVVVLAVFGQTLWHDFILFDDDEYVFQNPAVFGGLSLEGVSWAFTHIHSNNWHPVTWLSHMLDCELYGRSPSGHHLTSVLIHAANAVLLFLVLGRMTGALWCSAFVAVLFAIHPLRVESVAWVAERKDLLAGLFFMLTLLAYTRYLRRQEAGVVGQDRSRGKPKTFDLLFLSSGAYWLVILFFALGLMSKPMLVTLPFVLVLLDYWPLNRFSNLPFQLSAFKLQVFIEKLPLLVLSAASCLVTVFAQTNAIASSEKLPLMPRLENALIAYTGYLKQTFWPFDLAVLYPWRANNIWIPGVILSFLILVGVSWGVLVLRRRSPYALTGWLWYLGMLVPVIGLVQVGNQVHADRYTYLPQIGLFIGLTWAVARLSFGWRHRGVLYGVMALILAFLAGRAWVQTSKWRDSQTLWVHTLEVSPLNSVALCNLGSFLFLQGNRIEAFEHYHRAIQIDPQFADPHNNLGKLLEEEGRIDEAIAYYRRALELQPDFLKYHMNLGNALIIQGNFAEAMSHFERALEISPGTAYDLNLIARVLAACPEESYRNGPKAVELARQAVGLSGGADPSILDTLAVAYAETRRFSEAINTAQDAIDLAKEQNNARLAHEIQARLELYQLQLPFRL